ncbi:tRNA (adenosine(37)-N6)-threonylcarbamoyltransferase complex ATPase subunit type 1 TsaE [Roseovarius sp. SYSU LYC5161]|uniref:tRNA (adenosine(37)-N6)-threonylcarbamoyltransferase complex ATPase subunit type 1 TsaE n=1 Tax=Roseovarius halophilus (ex Wu et al. 2025) TaxID=3376060 RepID=UPI0028720C0E|nr:tRNA (adenosine(37)-N6)-threonylcarbamoyltransferase complex ATPase subunit type 1 TsaE [Roseovarius sp.]
MTARDLTFRLDSPEATAALARRIAARLEPGDVLLLDGPVGAGKTQFARNVILECLSVHEDVPSPTYTLVQTYDGRAGEIWHADLYRLGDTSELEELGLSEAFEHAICLVEWPDCLGDMVPGDALTLTFSVPHGDDRRDLVLHWTDPRWNSRLDCLNDDA